LHNSLLHLLLKNGDFLNTDISQGSVTTHLGGGAVLVYDFVTNFLLSLSERILKIGQYLVKLWARVRCLVFLTHSVFHPFAQKPHGRICIKFGTAFGAADVITCTNFLVIGLGVWILWVRSRKLPSPTDKASHC